MDPRDLIPIEVEVEPTPFGRRPFNRWVTTGAGGDPFEPRGLYPATRGERVATGYDGLGPARSQVGMGTAKRFVGLQGRLRGLAQEPPEKPKQGYMLLAILGGAAGVALAYITYDETVGTGARLRRRRF